MQEPTASPSAAPAPPPGPPGDSDLDFIARAARMLIVGGFAIAVVLVTLWVLKAALTPLAVAFLIAYLLDPLIDRLERRGVPRRLAIVLLMTVLSGVLLGLLLFVIPQMQRDIASLIERFPGYLERLQSEWIPALEQRFGIRVPPLGELAQSFQQADLTVLLDALRGFLASTFTYIAGTITALFGLLVIPILAYYALADFDAIVGGIGSTIPTRYQAYMTDKARTVDRLIAAFLRGQLTIAGILAVLYSIGFSVIGVDLAIGVGCLGGALALIPYLGNAVAVSLASLLCVLEFGADWHLAAVLGWYAVVQNLEGFVLTPRIVGKSVGLHPAVVIVALLIGGDLFGFLGLLVAVPVTACLKVFFDELLELYRGSGLFQREGA